MYKNVFKFYHHNSLVIISIPVFKGCKYMVYVSFKGSRDRDEEESHIRCFFIEHHPPISQNTDVAVELWNKMKPSSQVLLLLWILCDIDSAPAMW